MEILLIILSILTFSILLFSFWKPKIGAMLYLVYMYMAPYLYIGGFIIYARSLAVIFLLLFLIKFGNKIKVSDYAPFKPYIYFLIWQFFLLFTAEHFGYSLNTWFSSCSILFYILFLYANIRTTPTSAKLYSHTLFYVFCIIVLYGLFLTTIPGLNPYQMLLQPIFGGEFNEAYAAGNSGLSTNTQLAEGRLFGRISSFFSHPMAYGLNLGLFFIYSLYFLRNKPKLLCVVLVCIFVAILTSGTRTPLGALALTSLAIILYLRRFKYFFYGLIAFFLIVYGVPIVYPEAEEYMLSIVDSDNSATQGSNLSMRLAQMEGCWDIVKYDFIVGKGYGWTNWYNEVFGTHPKALWFESLIFTILVNTGFVGFLIWGWFIRGYYKYVTTHIKDLYSRTMLLALLFYYLIYSIITGDFGINYVFVFYVVMLGMLQMRAK